MENWRKFSRLVEERSYLRNFMPPDIPTRVSERIFKQATLKAKRMLKKSRLTVGKPVKFVIEDIEEYGTQESETNEREEIIGHTVAVSSRLLEEVYSKIFSIIDNYFSVLDGAPALWEIQEYEILVESVSDLCELSLLPTLIHELMHCAFRENDIIDTSGDDDTGYYFQKEENFIRNFEKHFVNNLRRKAEKILFQEVAPIFSGHAKPEEFIPLLVGIQETWNKEIDSGIAFFQSKEHLKNVSKGGMMPAMIIKAKRPSKR
jgi:hypothetical protein